MRIAGASLYLIIYKSMNRQQLIKEISAYFSVQELVCPHIFSKWGEASWQFLDTAFLETLLVIRRDIIRLPMLCNTSNHTQRGIRCNRCKLVGEKSGPYLSAHVLGKAGDFTIVGLSAEEARQRIIDNAALLPYNIRLEADVSWLHIDVLPQYDIHSKVYIFRG